MSQPLVYDRLTRIFHHLVAAGILFLMLSVVLRVTWKDSALYDAIWPWHRPVGFLTGVAILFRWIWRLIARHLRPSPANTASRLGHLIMYVLMAAIPLIGLMRQHGSGREFSPFGIPLMSAKETSIDWMVTLGNTLHGPLGWVLMAMVSGHILIAGIHAVRGDHQVIRKMFGKPDPAP